MYPIATLKLSAPAFLPESLAPQDLAAALDAAQAWAEENYNNAVTWRNIIVKLQQELRDSGGDVPSTRTLTAGTGLSGGGDLSADRTFDLDHSGMTSETDIEGADAFPFRDDSASAERVTLWSNLVTKAGAAFRTVGGIDIEVDSSGAYYMGDPVVNGTWRMVRSGNDLVFQRRESGSYVTKSTISA